MKSKWDIIKDFINSHDAFTKKELREKYNIILCSTTEQYILLFMNAGFLIRIGRGSYKRDMFIPDNITSSNIIELSYDKIKRDKYKRRTKLEKIKKDTE